MALDLKSVVRNQVASRTSRALKGGLTKVAGNILGSALGSASPTNAPFIGFGGNGPFAIKMLSFPSDVAGDPRQGHYINFSIHKIYHFTAFLSLLLRPSFCRNLFNCSNCELCLFTHDFKRKIFINLFSNYGLAKR